MDLLRQVKRSGAALCLAVVTLFFYWRVLFTNRFMFPWDAADQFYPSFAFVHEELRHFRLPLWDPYIMSGYPIIGDIQAQIFYPINWLFVLLSPFSPLPYRLVEIQNILHFFLAGLFMYLLACEFVESRAAALLAGVLFMCSGAMVAHTQHIPLISAVAWYPLVFLFFRRALLQRNAFYTLCAGMLFGVQILAGHWQDSVYLGLLLFLYGAYEACLGAQRRTLWPGWILSLVVIAGLGAALAMAQIVPCYELGRHSVHESLNYWEVAAGNDPRFLLTLFIPNFRGGINGFPQTAPYDVSYNYVYLTVPGCMMALFGLVSTLRRRNFFWIGTLVLFIDLSLGDRGHLAGLVYRTPILNLFRTMAGFFNVANFLLCLLAAIGAERLFAKEVSPRWKKAIAIVLGLLLVAGFGAGFPGSWAGNIPSFRHALAVLLIVSAMVMARLQSRLTAAQALGAVIVLVVFDLCFYNSNQVFNSQADHPSTFMSHDYAVGRKESLQFLRSDRASDFRVAALGEYQWSGNGWNVWRIPGTTGVNPMALRRYDDYVRGFSHALNARFARGSEDYNPNSPLVDLLRVKYLVVSGSERAGSLGLSPLGKFRPVFDDLGWWLIYRNEQAMPPLRFYPQANVLPSEEAIYAFLGSAGFDPNRTLLLEKEEFPLQNRGQSTDLFATQFTPQQGIQASESRFIVDPYCAIPKAMVGGWGRRGSQIFLDVPENAPAGHYRLVAHYAANGVTIPSLLNLRSLNQDYPWYDTTLSAMPRLRIEIENGGAQQHPAQFTLPRTIGWSCNVSRMADLGEWEFAPGQKRIVITSVDETALNIYGFWLIRSPNIQLSEPAGFSFSNFSASANRISFDSKIDRDGYVLLTEIYYPGWKAWVNGAPSAIYPANGLFRALFLTAGLHHIEFQFRPRYFFLGLFSSIITLAGFLAYLAVYRRKTRIAYFANGLLER